MTEKRYQKVLIANRGEIARRIARTLRHEQRSAIGLASIYDPSAGHIHCCDESILLDEPNIARVFLHPEIIINAAREAGADAIHPGYGFLSESSELAQACNNAGIAFIGPTPELLSLFGDKAKTKERAKTLGIPVVETHCVEPSTLKQFLKKTKDTKSLNYPLLIKARGGGGGRGMRLVQSFEEFEPAVASASREAEKFFGDGTLLIEPFLKSIKHIEVQIAGDIKGHVVHLHERECSAQRNYQKILEEAPSQGISENLRQALFKDAIRLFEKLKYQGLATVEFLVTEDESHYFTEVNPRLQVEHTVTEEILDIDLVSLQLHLAEGKSLKSYSKPLENLTPSGHAIQARINAESSIDFLPQTGTLLECIFPNQLRPLRVESAVTRDSSVTSDYDSLIAKCIQHGESRRNATTALIQNLQSARIFGVETNIPFLLKVLKTPAWQDASYTTDITKVVQEATPSVHALVLQNGIAAILSLYKSHQGIQEVVGGSSWNEKDGFRSAGISTRSFVVECKGIAAEITVHQNTRETFHILHEDRSYEVSITPIITETTAVAEPLLIREYDLTIDGIHSRVRVVPLQRDKRIDELFWVESEAFSSLITLSRPALRQEKSGASASTRNITSPLPGKVLRLLADVGQSINAGEPLILLESMKMEHTVNSQSKGSVERLEVSEGDVVSSGQLLATIA
ncbi:ATP-grasp domain-containing protein [bacterium]|nr:ATP-grasp domain-containing protein [bacterium]